MRLAALLEPIARRREPELAHALRSVPLFRALPSAALVALTALRAASGLTPSFPN